MRRRAYLRTLTAPAASAGLATVTGLAGCSTLAGEAGDRTLPPVLEDRPSGVYRPTHASGVRLVGTADVGDLRVALLYSYPDRFWELVGRQTYRRSVAEHDSVHLMTLVWDPVSGVVLPEVGLTTEIGRDGDLVAREAVYAMLSQRLGFHYGDNFALPGDGEYDVHVSVGGLQIRRTGAFADRFGDPASATVAFPYSRADRNGIEVRRPANAGQRGALAPVSIDGIPDVRAPAVATLPGDHLGRAETGDAVLDFLAVGGDAATRLGATGDAEYLAVLARTPHTGLLLPAMGVAGRVTSPGGTQFDGTLSRTVDPVLGYHYGAAVPPLSAGDTVTLRILTPPQVARHEGYETAFVEMPPVSITV